MNEKPSTSTAVWIGAAKLEQENPSRDQFQASEIIAKIYELDLARASTSTVSMHVSLHCVANVNAAPNNLRFLVRVKNGWYRLFREGDEFHESRKDGRVIPKQESMPQEYRDLLDWYGDEKSTNDLDESNHDGDSNLFFGRIDEKNSVTIPFEIMDSLKVRNGDHVAFIKNDDCVMIKKAKVRLEI